ncbi:MAG: hypothetical protein NTU94_03315 [Planctomycetota bacterium]|nr:hypothetical protein [Planctomycetota bacterium]
MPERPRKEAPAKRRGKTASPARPDKESATEAPALDQAALQETLARCPPRLVRSDRPARVRVKDAQGRDAGNLRGAERSPGEFHPKDLHQEAQKARAIRVGKMLKFEKTPTPLSAPWQKLMDFLKPFWTSEHHAEVWELYKRWTRVADADAPTLEDLAAKAGMSAQDWIATKALSRIRQYVDGHSHLRAVLAPAKPAAASAAGKAGRDAQDGAKAAENDTRDYRPATEVQAILDMSYKRFIKWLADHPAIRRRKPSKNRLLVHIGDALASKAQKDKRESEATDDQSAKDVSDRYRKTIEERKAKENARRARRTL